ncbi:MAG: DNA-processing protein DprA [Gemmatimonadales bacterium]
MIFWSPDERRQRAAYVALALTPGLGAARFVLLQQACDSPLGALSAPFAFLRAIPGITKAAATAVRAADADVGERMLADAERMGAVTLLPHDPAFPAQLREIPDPPPVLFAQGDVSLLGRPSIAVVGSRDHTPYGATACCLVVRAAVQGGAVVVSGMARGIDAVAHAAALDAGGTTVGVLGNGLGVIYPAANRALYERVLRDGALVSEYPPGERPRVFAFPRRNRLISGLARATVVVEAAVGSGALITVSAALEQGRDVLAVPGPITARTSVGANGLIRDGATPYLAEEDLERFLPSPPARRVAAVTPMLPAELPAAERRVAEELMSGEVDADRLAERLGIATSDTLALVTALELRGLVEPLPGARFRLRVP